MRERRAAQERRRAREFEAFVAGAAGRLLHAAMLLTGDRDAAERLLTAALARTYAGWDRLHGEDPYDRTRQELIGRFAHGAWHHRRVHDGVLGGLTPRERLVLVLRLYEGVPEEQTAARLGLPVERVRAICLRSMTALRSRAASPGGSVPRGPAPPGPAPRGAAPPGAAPGGATPLGARAPGAGPPGATAASAAAADRHPDGGAPPGVSAR
ncbi:sigma factor-like helix-turn-helix DNA-binding protein [Streptomyces sp. NPDC001922]|uniref:sigma factor-like helix-turn-helix DNA-binding protein n=1 Tax=Streptomyces sp. NPDC001922 TaxID=3364624 RepID=UPI0036B65FF2